MAGVQLLRIETHKHLEDRLVAHVRGVTRPPTARPVDPAIVSIFPPVELGAIHDFGGVGAAAAREAIKRHWPRGRGARPRECIDLLIAGPPRYGDPDQWSTARELEWARETVAWVTKMLGSGAVVVTAALHRDETSPHVQLVVIPVDEAGRLSWKSVRTAAVKRARAAGVQPTGRTAYGTIQDWYQQAVGRRYALGRGAVGSQAQHEAVDRAAAAERREELAKRGESEAAARAQAAEREAAQYREASAELAADLQRTNDHAAELRHESARLRGEREVAERATAEAQAQRQLAQTEFEAAQAQVRREAEYGGGVLGLVGLAGQRGREALEAAVAERTGELRDAAERAERAAREDREARERAQAVLATRTTERDEARQALERDRSAAHGAARGLELQLARARAWASRWRGWATRARRTHRDEVDAATRTGFNTGFARGVRSTVSYLLTTAREHLPGSLVAILDRCHEAGTLQPLLEARTPPEWEEVSSAARERAPARRSGGGPDLGAG